MPLPMEGGVEEEHVSLAFIHDEEVEL